MYLLYRHRWNTRIFPVTKIWYQVKIQFLSFTCEDIWLMSWLLQSQPTGKEHHLYDKQNITCPLVDTNFIFECSTRYLTRSLRSLAIYWVEHSKIKFVSTREHVISSIFMSVLHLTKDLYVLYISRFINTHLDKRANELLLFKTF